MKTILCFAQDDPALDSRLDTATALARALSAHLSCVHVMPVDNYVATDPFGIVAMPMVMTELGDRQEQSRRRVEQRLAGAGVAWDYRSSRGPLVSQLVSDSALADLVVVSRGNTAFLAELVQRLRSPLLIPGEQAAAFNPLGTALIAWNGSYEAANAVRFAVGLLKLAAQVQVLTVADEEKGDDDERLFPNTALLEYLSRHDIHAELASEPRAGRRPADILKAEAVRLGAAYLVMGSYSHSRINEMIFGGVTRELLASCPVALVTTH